MSTITTTSDIQTHFQGESVLAFAEVVRSSATKRLDKKRQSELGQYFTPFTVATRLAALLEPMTREVRLLDAGAGIGVLSAAAVEMLRCRKSPPQSIHVSTYEIDSSLHGDLESVLEACARACKQAGIAFTYNLGTDFLESAINQLLGQLFAEQRYTCAILNPPYKKIRRTSTERRLLERVDIETTNLYTGFLALAAQLLEPGGELVSVTPRSFCNGPYFRPFRKAFLRDMAITDLQVFETRSNTFEEVLQESLIMRAVKTKTKPETVTVLSLASPDDPLPTTHRLSYEGIVRPDDPEAFIHVVTDSVEKQIAASMGRFKHSLSDLGLHVSTGKVVDFRVKDALKLEPEAGSVPLLYPHNLEAGFVTWPVTKHGKPQALMSTAQTKRQLLPAEMYVLVKRFSSKEERRRVVAALYDPARIDADAVGIENHLNYLHSGGRGFTRGPS